MLMGAHHAFLDVRAPFVVLWIICNSVSVLRSQPQPKIQLPAQPQIQPLPVPGNQPLPVAQIEPFPVPQPQAFPVPQTQPDPVPKTQVLPVPQTRALPVPRTQPLPLPQTRPEILPLRQPRPQLLPLPQTLPESIPLAQTRPEPLPLPQTRPEPLPLPQTRPEPLPQTQPETLPPPQTQPETLPPPQTQPIPQPKPLLVTQNAVTLNESMALVKFKASLQHVDNKETLFPDWNPVANPPPCLGNNSIWIGIICFKDRVWGLHLHKMGLTGSLDLDALIRIRNLRILTISNNHFEGPLPDLRKLTTLRLVFFSNNNFSGNISDDAFLGLNGLRRLVLANNSFTGKVPSSVTKMGRLVDLRLEGNQFQGSIPNFTEGQFWFFNVSHNQLEGSIPLALQNMSADAFSGNKGLCGPPLGPCPGDGSSWQSMSWLIWLIIALVLLFLLLMIVIILGVSRRERSASTDTDTISISHNSSDLARANMAKAGIASGDTKPAPRPSRKVPDVGKLIFVREDIEQFDLAELLRSSAEVLGSGHFGSSYKAFLPNGKPMVVKRFRHMNKMARQDFHEHIVRLGKLRHPNVLPIVSYYYRREEKLFVLDFVEKGSLASKLHGNLKGKELDWPRRLNIIRGVARGLSYLNDELHYNLDQIPSHGHLKSSNVLLNDSLEAVIMDYGLIPVVNQDQAQQVMLAYKSPDFSAQGNISKKTDVWCLGILILEVLTGKFPTSSLRAGKDENDLESWVEEIDKSSGVFDKDMGGTEGAEDQVRKLLNIGLSCCQKDLGKRPDMGQAVAKIGEIKS